MDDYMINAWATSAPKRTKNDNEPFNFLLIIPTGALIGSALS